MPGRTHCRFLAIAILAALAVTLAVALPGVSADGDEDQAPLIPEKAELKYPNLGSHLDQLVASVEDGETTAADAAAGASMHREESVAVTIYLSGSVDDVVQFLEDFGGDPRNMGEDYIEAYVPVSLLGPVSEQPGVIRVREIVPPMDEFGPVTSEGARAHLSASWNQAGYTGRGVKIGIIDGHADFTGYGSLIGSELPPPAGVRCYTDIGVPTQDLADCEGEGDHGTLVAESLVDIAPEASLYIASPSSLGDLHSTVDWMVSQGVSVIVNAETYIFDGPGNGTSPFSNSALRAVDRAVDGGIIWVAAAGNQARTTWFSRAPFLDGDGDGFIEFAVGDEVNGMTLEAGDRIVVQLRWDDKWGGASTDLNLVIQDNVAGRLAALSTDPQSGAVGHFPFERLVYTVPVSSGYGIGVGHVSGGVPDWIQLMVWHVPFIEHYTRNGSIGNPAESAKLGMLAVGAAHWDDVRAIEPYSSRGPAPDRRFKPDVVGAACGATSLTPVNEYNEGFCGTSQAAPHVAGMAALVRQRFPTYTPAQVADYLKDNAGQRQSPDPNNTWGHGFIQLPPPDGTAPAVPVPSDVFTRNPAADFNTLGDASNGTPGGIWSDGDTMWVTDWLDEKIYAYDMATRARVPDKDFDTLEAAENTRPAGVWSDGDTMWVTDWLDEKIYAYDMATRARVPGKDFDALKAVGNIWPVGIWSDGDTMWVTDWLDEKIYAYDMATKARVSARDFDTLKAARNVSPEGIWSDGETMWVADSNYDKIYAYDMATRARVPGREFNVLEAAGNWGPRGIWSGDATMWVSDSEDDKIYAYHMAQAEFAADREALVALYNATGGANWTNKTNWLTNAPIGQWHGVTTDANGRVTDLSLGENRLTGRIPTELGSLTNLTELSLWGDELTGGIPAELGRLTNLTVLDLSENQLSGEIPAELGSLPNLEDLSLWDNELTGGIPAELGRLTNVTVLDLSENQLTGETPAELGSLPNLEDLSLWDNELTGEIPSELGSLPNLGELSLTRNQLSGEIPLELGDLSNLTVLALGGNELTGEIPAELGRLTNLTVLDLSENQLTGEMPAELGSLPNLEDLSLWDNELTGEIPSELGSLPNLGELSLTRNQLSGEIPLELGDLSNLTVLALGGNELTGEIPAELGRLTNLTVLDLSENQLTREMPAELGSLLNLEELYLWDNELIGEIPAELGSLTNLQLLSLSSNQLSGTVPEELGHLTNLEELYLWDNRLSGMVPETLVGLIMLETFEFHHNPGFCAPVDDAFQTWLRGISTVLGSSCAPEDSPEDRAVLTQVHSATDGANWTNNTNWSSERFTREWYGVTTDASGRVHGLFLDSNQLTGNIPSELGGLTELERLYLDGNQLTGRIPSELGDLANLRVLSLGDNRLTGEIPAELGRLTNLTVLRLAGNQLTGCVPAALTDVEDNDFAQLGLPFCPSYDANGDGAIDIGELFTAIDDYFEGLIDISELFTIIDLYFSGPG